jgi:hypothetical protein
MTKTSPLSFAFLTAQTERMVIIAAIKDFILYEKIVRLLWLT